MNCGEEASIAAGGASSAPVSYVGIGGSILSWGVSTTFLRVARRINGSFPGLCPAGNSQWRSLSRHGNF